MKFGIHIGPIAEHVCLFCFNFCQVVFEIQGVKNHTHQGKKKVCVQGFSFITPLIMHLEKHSGAHCKAYELFFLTIYNYTSQLVKLQSYKWRVMKFGN
jgi:hypothetical protein